VFVDVCDCEYACGCEIYIFVGVKMYVVRINKKTGKILTYLKFIMSNNQAMSVRYKCIKSDGTQVAVRHTYNLRSTVVRRSVCGPSYIHMLCSTVRMRAIGHNINGAHHWTLS
jgi:hypothetical protein